MGQSKFINKHLTNSVSHIEVLNDKDQNEAVEYSTGQAGTVNLRELPFRYNLKSAKL